MEYNKIFGIGLPRTGHTSLTKALSILGYKSIKIPIACVNPDLSIKYKSLDDYDAWTDTPITMKYIELDKLYPDAKFILLTRNIDSWLESCSTWFAFKRMKDATDYHALHKSIFGTAFYDKEKFIHTYEKYYYDLFNHWSNTQKFLSIDICKWDAWDSICEFLNKDIPTVPFPHLNKQEKLNEI